MDVNDGCTVRAQGSGGSGGNGVGEDNFAEVVEGDETTVLLEVFYDPLSVLLAECRRRAELLGDGLTGCGVLNDSGTRCRARGGDSGSDDISRVDVEVVEIVGTSGEPLVPG